MNRYEKQKYVLTTSGALALLSPGTIVTPFPLIDAAVAKLPIEWDNKDLRFLDPACGRGAFLFVVKEKLLQAGRSERCAIEDMLYGIDIASENADMAVAVVDPSGKHKNNIKCTDALAEEIMLEDDFIAVMNPPWNSESSTRNPKGNRRSNSKKYHTYFIEKMLPRALFTAVVCPTKGWFDGRGSKLKQKLLKGKHIHSVERISARRADEMFKRTVGDLGIFILAREACTITHVYRDGVHLEDVSAGSDVSFNDKSIQVLLTKLLYKERSLAADVVVACGPNRESAMQYATRKGKALYVPIIGNADDPLELVHVDERILDPNDALYKHRDYKLNKNLNSVRVGINFAGTPGKLHAMKIIPAGVVVSRNVTTISCKSTKAARRLITLLQTSKLMRFVIALTHTGKNNSKQTFKYVPAVSLVRDWTDQELYKHFKLTKDEIKLIEDTIK